ncbi:MAG: aldose 1-epimerase family protein [Bacteroidia bacterium]|jgi:galactose mutarotase-like enzyme|nr:aldose 1-epimerase family protein [Bacteroidia bacterium]
MKNQWLHIYIESKGAEVKSVKDQETGYEYMWQANPEVWGRTAPVLFPIVGKVKNNQLLIDGTAYPMGQHGFARDALFNTIKKTDNEHVFKLASNAHTLEVYPYHFELEIAYKLNQRTLQCIYKICNTDSKEIYFSIGAHPGFAIPDNDLNSCILLFEKPETASRMLLSQGLFDGRSKPLLNNSNTLSLNTQLFDEDAVVFHQLQSKQFTLQKKDSPFSIQMVTNGLTDLGIWSQKGSAAFVCIEPWCGFADSTDGHDDVSTKPGILRLKPGDSFTCNYAISFHS